MNMHEYACEVESYYHGNYSYLILSIIYYYHYYYCCYYRKEVFQVSKFLWLVGALQSDSLGEETVSVSCGLGQQRSAMLTIGEEFKQFVKDMRGPEGCSLPIFWQWTHTVHGWRADRVQTFYRHTCLVADPNHTVTEVQRTDWMIAF